ncbi:choline/carnitine O-acyltransferase [Vagococcus intermedius]|uniref:Choline/carnitine O-acyltransferase n=1 Tax=Vagococcus intermedius TaxID=2991418 RepID=A0AAF0CU67_9ENTE|nr:choline/carnitine O-acyltransferase [Vagococcus intermedius]WEG73053.1 choline/carnitine O-acyltransferase [Vagococcus intermedius]WEG75137.1 choline/carnitine O-acyltransferase [Vagococcus intermedius]
MQTFWQDSNLDSLPIPTITKTCDIIREMTVPFVENVEEHKELVSDLEILVKNGKVLQKKLHTLQQQLGGNRSWLRPFWDDTYTSNHKKIAGVSNYAFQLNKASLKEQQPLEYLILGIVNLALSIEENELLPEKIGDQFLSMEMFHHIFYTRVPGEQQSLLQRSLLKGEIRIGVVHQGAWYLITVADAKHRLVSPNSLATCLTSIRKGNVKGATKSLIGAMTTMTASEASQFRNQLQKKQINRLSLKNLEETLFTVSLDEDEVKEGQNQFLFGEASNRWFFKSLQLIQSVTGEIGLNFEHAGCDGSNWVYLLSQLTMNEPVQSDLISFSDLSILPLKWQLDASDHEIVRQSNVDFINESKKHYTVLVKDDTLCRQLFKGEQISPDACLQLAFMAAYYHQRHRFPSIYESVSMRHFYEGRTEVARPMTNEAHYFISAFVGNKNSDITIYELLLKAIASHNKMLKQNQIGQGAERHLLGLSFVITNLEESMYLKIMKNSTFLRAVKNSISTSSLSSPLISQFIFSPVVDNGLGIGYGLLTTGLQVAITGNQTDFVLVKEYSLLVRSYLEKIAQLIKRFS